MNILYLQISIITNKCETNELKLYIKSIKEILEPYKHKSFFNE